MLSKDQKQTVLNAVDVASTAWKSAFNNGDAAGCAKQYETNASMRAEPFGTFKGTAEIQGFWQSLIEQGYTDVNYVEPKIDVIDSTSAILKSGWKMNKASGIIHQELWVIQADGRAKLREDHFEAKA
jgi:ketosteroid isomerase-like protein